MALGILLFSLTRELAKLNSLVNNCISFPLIFSVIFLNYTFIYKCLFTVFLIILLIFTFLNHEYMNFSFTLFYGFFVMLLNDFMSACVKARNTVSPWSVQAVQLSMREKNRKFAL